MGPMNPVCGDAPATAPEASVRSASSPAEAQDFLLAVERALNEDLLRERERSPRVLENATRHLCFAGLAKRARPQLVSYFGAAVNAPQHALVDVAVAAELMHSASLLHDDVIDEGTMRRGRPTANARWGNSVAVLAGDLALTIAFTRLRPYTQDLTAKAVSVVQDMTRAAMLEIEACGDVSVSPSHWKVIAEGKTGALFGFCGYGAALITHETDRARRFDTAGRHLGIAFQMADDLDDLFERGDADPFADIREQNPSYPVIVAAAHSSSLRANLAAAWAKESMSQSDAASLGREVLATGATDITLREIRLEVAAARAALVHDVEHQSMMEVMFWAETLARHPGDRLTPPTREPTKVHDLRATPQPA